MPKHSQAELRAEFYSLPTDALLDRSITAAGLHFAVSTMDAYAIRGGGPRFIKIGRRVLYRKSDVLAWLESTGREVENTAQILGGAAQ